MRKEDLAVFIVLIIVVLLVPLPSRAYQGGCDTQETIVCKSPCEVCQGGRGYPTGCVVSETTLHSEPAGVVGCTVSSSEGCYSEPYENFSRLEGGCNGSRDKVLYVQDYVYGENTDLCPYRPKKYHIASNNFCCDPDVHPKDVVPVAMEEHVVGVYAHYETRNGQCVRIRSVGSDCNGCK